MGNGISIRLSLISEIFSKPYAVESVSKFNTSDKSELFRKLL
jgi:hypothetical protein